MLKKKKALRAAIPILAAAVLFSVFLSWLYRHDNKYTHKGTQAISGMLILDRQALEEEQVFYLTQGWQFYPGKLLVPEDFAEGRQPSAYMQTVTIGRQNNFDLTDRNHATGGSASYHLIIALPEEERAYTLVLPEVYSAYRLYVNGAEVLSSGTPEDDGFKEKIIRRSVTFPARGQAELLLAVSNHTHFYDGMTYPPVFGIPEAVGQAENIRLMLGLLLLVLAGLCVVLSLYLLAAFRGRRERKLVLFFFLSLCITLTYLYPVVFQYTEVSPGGWYAIEFFSIYGTYLFAVMLQNQISGLRPALRKLSAVPVAVFTGIAVLYALLPGYFVWQIQLFGVLATVVKFSCVVYLLGCTIYTAMKERPGSRLLLSGTAALGISLLYDRLHSDWEPILGRWPVEYGCLALLLGLGVVLWQELSEGYRFKLAFEEEKRQLTRQVAMQKAHYLELTDKIEDTIRIRHDERHHLQVLYSLYETGDYTRLGEYLSGYVQASMPKEHTVLCRHLIVGSMLRYYEKLCGQAQICFSCSAVLPPRLPVSDVELSLLFGNLLENAYEAAKQKGVGEPFVSCQAAVREDTFYLLIRNSFVTPVRRRGRRFLSAKHGGYGVGTQSARSVAEHYGGECVFEDKDGVFSVSVMILFSGTES